jgi:HPt (histidine-containing phosphotransfer) domain-containing protein
MIDFEKIKTTYFLDHTSLQKLLHIFVESVNQDLSSLENSIDHLEYELIHNTAHKIKAGFRYFFLDNIVQKLEKLQADGKNKDIAAIILNYSETKLLISKTLADIENYFQTN